MKQRSVAGYSLNRFCGIIDVPELKRSSQIAQERRKRFTGIKMLNDPRFQKRVFDYVRLVGDDQAGEQYNYPSQYFDRIVEGIICSKVLPNAAPSSWN